jgi:hypothetical protein
VGNFFCEDEVELCQKEENGKWSLRTLSTKGKTELTYPFDPSIKQLLLCYGQMRLDQERLVLSVESPPGLPIEYIHGKMKLKADQAQVDYTEEGSHITAQKLFLSGKVHLTSEDHAFRCALADHFSYFPEEKKMVLSSQSEENVLFWDEEQQLTISAREIHLSQDEKGENVKGVGNVRFAFTSTENALLKKIFPFYRPKRGDL